MVPPQFNGGTMAGRKLAGNLLQDADRQENEENIRKAYAEEASYGGQESVLPTTPETQALIDLGDERAANNLTIGNSDVKIYDDADTAFDNDINSLFGNIDEDVQALDEQESREFSFSDAPAGLTLDNVKWKGPSADPILARDALRKQTKANFGRDLTDAELDNIIASEQEGRKIPGTQEVLGATREDFVASTKLPVRPTADIGSFNKVITDTILGAPKQFENANPELTLANKDAIYTDALRAIGVDTETYDTRNPANTEAVKLYTASLLDAMQSRLSTIEDKNNQLNSDLKAGKISKNEAALQLRDYSDEQGQLNIANISDTAIRNIQKWQAADAAAASGQTEINDANLPVVNEQSARALGALVLGSLSQQATKDGHTWLKEEKEDTSEEGKLSDSFSINEPMMEVLGQLSKLTRTTGRTKAGYKTSAISPIGQGLGDATAQSGSQLGSGLDLQAQKVVADVARKAIGGRPTDPLARSVDYFGTRQVTTISTSLNTNLGMLRSVVNNLVKPDGIPANAKFNNMIVSNSPFSAQFAISYQSVVNTLNSSAIRPERTERIDIYRPEYLANNTPMNDRFRSEIRRVGEEMTVQTKYEKPLYASREDISEVLNMWYQSSVNAHNARASDHINAIMAATAENGKVFTYEFDTMGKNMRTQIRNSVLSIQSNPILRGVINQAKPVVIPNPKADNNLTKKFRMAAVFNLGLVHPMRAAEVASGKITKKYKPEFESSQQILRETYDIHFGDYKKAEQILKRYSNTINVDEELAKVRKKGASLMAAANALRGFEVVNGRTVKINSNDPVRNTKPNNQMGQLVLDASLEPNGLTTGWRQPAVQQALNQFQGGGFNPAQEQAIAEALGFVDSNGNPHAREKEGSLAINTLLNIADFQKGTAFEATLQYEKDGANNGFALIGLMTLDPNSDDYNALLTHSGIINTGMNRISNLPLLPNGDMREFFNRDAATQLVDLKKEAMAEAEANALELDYEQGKELVETTETRWNNTAIGLEAIQQSATWKEAWKQVIMQAGYGKDLGSFGQLIDGLVDADPELRAKLSNYLPDGVDPAVIMRDVAETSGALLQRVLNPVDNYTTTLKNIAAHISHANQQVIFENYSGRQLGLTKEQFRNKPLRQQLSKEGPHGVYFIDEYVETRINNPLESVKIFSSDLNKNIRLASSAMVPSPEEQKTYFSGNKYKTKIAQISGLPPLLVHSKDASTMTETGSDFYGTDTTFLPIFDAIYSNFENFGEIEKTYNNNLMKVMRNSNYYKDGLAMINRSEKDNMRDLSLKAAMFYFNDAVDIEVSNKLLEDNSEAPNYKGRKTQHDTVETPQSEIETLQALMENKKNKPELYAVAKRLVKLHSDLVALENKYLDDYKFAHGKAFRYSGDTKFRDKQEAQYKELEMLNAKYDADLKSAKYRVDPKDMKLLIEFHNLTDPMKAELKSKSKLFDIRMKKFTREELPAIAKSLGIRGITAENAGEATFNMPWAYADDDR